ncbi:hypothetical protein L7F22_036054 [Adiantum nelumboides]|nr:hypothetical protein [Adiantum nelumboides]
MLVIKGLRALSLAATPFLTPVITEAPSEPNPMQEEIGNLFASIHLMIERVMPSAVGSTTSTIPAHTSDLVTLQEINIHDEIFCHADISRLIDHQSPEWAFLHSDHQVLIQHAAHLINESHACLVRVIAARHVQAIQPVMVNKRIIFCHRQTLLPDEICTSHELYNTLMLLVNALLSALSQGIFASELNPGRVFMRLTTSMHIQAGRTWAWAWPLGLGLGWSWTWTRPGPGSGQAQPSPGPGFQEYHNTLVFIKNIFPLSFLSKGKYPFACQK